MVLLWPVAGLVALVILLFALERRFPDTVGRFEENVLALLLAAITFVSFTQVIARYGFNSGWGGALELTRILFAWMILFGMGYGVKQGIHLGVDAFVRMMPSGLFRIVAIFGAVCVFLYAFILLYAAWLSFFGAPVSTNWRQTGAIGYWKFMFDRGTGLDDLRYPLWMQDAFGLQDRVQRWVAYLMLPIGLALLAFRALQGVVAIAKGQREMIIASHEAEDLVAENKDALKE
ncbi:TRAP-type C4-dicarboxylate transporter, small permease [Nitratireductor indicus C115]|uniref:TRAP transporter small permease protein n=1 Tax=Nitratireductor indicus C115 TaxID=1231190 RepID=K2N4P7_9HYPH|nr:TRAP transporter small permease [Nitratireductor indicus]EKF42373.1 TRAP-type C4-dicarboxylate transporter, small permease [Nitratireductor indicus C115]SFQ55402.1 C4-dicarboxylate transporter, DctQ subunit [Nitratireductor indicus]